MIKKWISRLTTKQIIISLAMVAVAIYVVWYVVDALEGLDPDYRPHEQMVGYGGAKIKGGAESMMFDPTKKTPETIPAK